MTQQNNSSKEAQYKIVSFLQGEVERLKLDCEDDIQKRNMKQKKNDKKRRKLFQQIESILKLNSLEIDIREELLSLEKQLKASL